MGGTLKVYGWRGFLSRERMAELETQHRQCRLIVAARSKAAAARSVGEQDARRLELCETGNAREIFIATAQPGVVFVRPDSGPNDREYFQLQEGERNG